MYVFGVAPKEQQIAVASTPISNTPGVTNLGNGLIKVQIRIPPGSVARLTGKSGATITQIQERTGKPFCNNDTR